MGPLMPDFSQRMSGSEVNSLTDYIAWNPHAELGGTG
jgi:hypothetical protein